MSGTVPGAQDDTRVHVAQLLQESVGAMRQSRVAVAELPLDDELTARGVEAAVRLTRIPAGILAKGRVAATLGLQCIRCLEEFDRPVEAEFADEYRPTIDIVTGAEIAPSAGVEDDEHFPISDVHVIDLRESLRQALVLELPMAPTCRDDCPGLPEATEPGGEADNRLAILGRLLADEPKNDDA
jgi:uncharacterized protein